MADDMTDGTEGNPAFPVFLRLWFWWAWRMALWLALVSVSIIVFAGAAAVVVTFLGASLSEADQARLLGVSRILGSGMGVVGGTLAWIQSLRGILGKTYGGYRLVLLRAKKF